MDISPPARGAWISCATPSNISPNSYKYDPLPDLDFPPETLIERFLEENYRAQAKAFVDACPAAIRIRSRYIAAADRGPFYFTKEERQGIADAVSASASTRYCPHQNCTNCINNEFAYYETKAMATSMAAEDRQRIINNNRSLRNIKNVRIATSAALSLLTSI